MKNILFFIVVFFAGCNSKNTIINQHDLWMQRINSKSSNLLEIKDISIQNDTELVIILCDSIKDLRIAAYDLNMRKDEPILDIFYDASSPNISEIILKPSIIPKNFKGEYDLKEIKEKTELILFISTDKSMGKAEVCINNKKITKTKTKYKYIKNCSL